MMAERRLQFVDGLGRDARCQDAMQPAQRIMKQLQPRGALFDAQADLLGFGHRTQAGQRRQIAIGWVFRSVVHKRSP